MSLRQRFSVTEVFQKGRKASRNSNLDSTIKKEQEVKMESDSNRASMDLEEFEFEDPSNQSQTG